MKISKYLKKAIKGLYKFPFLKKPYPKYPFGKKKRANKKKYLDLYIKAINQDEHKIIDFEKKCGFSINKDWVNDLALHTQIVIKKEELNFFHGRLLYSLLSKYINQKKINGSFSNSLIILEIVPKPDGASAF